MIYVPNTSSFLARQHRSTFVLKNPFRGGLTPSIASVCSIRGWNCQLAQLDNLYVQDKNGVLRQHRTSWLVLWPTPAAPSSIFDVIMRCRLLNEWLKTSPVVTKAPSLLQGDQHLKPICSMIHRSCQILMEWSFPDAPSHIILQQPSQANNSSPYIAGIMSLPHLHPQHSFISGGNYLSFKNHLHVKELKLDSFAPRIYRVT